MSLLNTHVQGIQGHVCGTVKLFPSVVVTLNVMKNVLVFFKATVEFVKVLAAKQLFHKS